MKKDLVHIFTGSLIDVQYYRERLEESNIPSMWQDENELGRIIGMGSIPNSVHLLVSEANAAQAIEIIQKLQQEA